MGDKQWFVLYVLVCLEFGVFLMLVPWSPIWERNYFLEAYPALRPWLLSSSVRGAVCGLGLANIYLGAREAFVRLRGGGDHGRVASSPLEAEMPRGHEAGRSLAAPDEP